MTHHTKTLEALAGTQTVAVLEDNLSPDGIARVFHGEARRLEAWSAAELPAFFAQIEAASAEGCWVVLAAAYELGYALEPKLAALMPQTDAPLARAWIWPQCEVLSRGEADALFAAALARLPSPHAGVSELEAGLDAQDHRAAVEQIRAWIDAGDCYQVNLTFPLRGRAWGDALALYARLRERQPVRYGGFLRHEDGAILCRSPELFVAREGRRLTVKPMKGTAPRGEADRLASSEKDRAENLMIVDLLRNDLGRLAPAGGVRVERLFEIEDYATLHQMTSTVSAAPVDADLFEIFRALFPCGSVTGAPKILAMERIRRLESGPRGLYCGAFGWIAPSGDFSFCVPIRTALVGGEGRLRLDVGSGIVADSEPASEYAECLAKGRFLTGLEPGFGLFETLLFEDGACPLLARHLARLSRSAVALGFRCDADSVRERLLAHARTLEGRRRVRLQLEADGRISISDAELVALAEGQTVCLASGALDSADALLRHKSTARSRYDAALQQAMALGHFDALFFNERGELCEGARSNVVVSIGGRLFTPPLACGLLPGVMRAELLVGGDVSERIVSREELLAADEIYVANALRGLLRVRLVPETISGQA